MGNSNQAEMAYLESLRHDDLDAARSGMAKLLVAAGRVVEAEALHRAGLQLKPDSRRRMDAFAAFMASQGPGQTTSG